MKVNVEIDCTPLEARQFLGLPDVAPMQSAVMDSLQQQMIDNIGKVSPEKLMQNWLTFDPKIAEKFQRHVRGDGRSRRRAFHRQEIAMAIDRGDGPAAGRLRPPASACCWPRRGEYSNSTRACCFRRF